MIMAAKQRAGGGVVKLALPVTGNRAFFKFSFGMLSNA